MDWSNIRKAEDQVEGLLDKGRKECRGGCGVLDATKFCGRCKETCTSYPCTFFRQLTSRVQ
jgi:hypothetical protein